MKTVSAIKKLEKLGFAVTANDRMVAAIKPGGNESIEFINQEEKAVAVSIGTIGEEPKYRTFVSSIGMAIKIAN